jgi:hypothetical protein
MKLFKSERKQLQEEFERFVSPEVIALLEKPLDSRKPQVEEKHFQFVLVGIDEEKPDEVPEIINRVVAGLAPHKATLSSITCSFILALLGVPFPNTDSPEARTKLVDALLTENGNRIRIAHGQCDGIVGSVGPQGNQRYGGIIPSFAFIVGKLLDTEFGTAIEVNR